MIIFPAIDIKDSKCSRVNNSIDARVIEGNGASQRILQKINFDDVDYFLALTRELMKSIWSLLQLLKN